MELPLTERHSLPGYVSLAVHGSSDNGLVISGGADGEVKFSKVNVPSSVFGMITHILFYLLFYFCANMHGYVLFVKL